MRQLDGIQAHSEISTTDTTEATSTTAAAIQTDGGIACVKDLIVGGTVSQGGNVIANENYIINGDFGVSQRGTSFSGGNVVANVDMWTGANLVDTVSVADGVMTFTGANAGSRNGVRIEGNSLNGKTVTVSFLARITTATAIEFYYFNDGGGAGVTGSMDGTVNSTTFTRVQKTFVVPSDGSGASFAFYIYSRLETIEIKELKLELGTEATPFVPDDPAVSMTKCQRYLRVYGLSTDAYEYVTLGYNNSAVQTYMLFEINMADSPSISMVGSWRIVDTAPRAVSSVAVFGSSRIALLQLVVSGAIVSAGCSLSKDNDAAARIYLSAEL